MVAFYFAVDLVTVTVDASAWPGVVWVSDGSNSIALGGVAIVSSGLNGVGKLIIAVATIGPWWFDSGYADASGGFLGICVVCEWASATS